MKRSCRHIVFMILGSAGFDGKEERIEHSEEMVYR